MKQILSLDVFRKLPKDLSEPTCCGAICKKLSDCYESLTHFLLSLFFSVNAVHSCDVRVDFV